MSFAESNSTQYDMMRWLFSHKELLSAVVVSGAVATGCGTGWLQDLPWRQDPSQGNVQTVRRNAGSEQIRQVQRRLNELNYDAGPVDGIMGVQTRGALRDFQYARGLAPTARLNDATLKALNIESADGETAARTRNKPATIQKARSSEENLGGDAARQAHDYPLRQQGLTTEGIRLVQQKLNDLGYDAGNVDGRWGPQTEVAIKNFQQARKIEVTGRLDNETLNALGIGESSRKGPGGPSDRGEQNKAREPRAANPETSLA